MKIDVSPCIFFFSHLPFSHALFFSSKHFYIWWLFSVQCISWLWLVSSEHFCHKDCVGFFLHLLHCLTTSPFTHFKNDLASVFIKIGLEIAWGGVFRAKLVWCWRLPCKSYKYILLGYKLCLALTKPAMYLGDWGRFWATLVGMVMCGVLEHVFIIVFSRVFAYVFCHGTVGFKVHLSLGRVHVNICLSPSLGLCLLFWVLPINEY